MSWREDRASLLLWLSTGLISLVVMIVGAVAWADHAEIGDQGKKIEALGAHRDDDHEAIQETRQDVKDIKQYLLDHKK